MQQFEMTFDVVIAVGPESHTHVVTGQGCSPHAARQDAERQAVRLLDKHRAEGVRLVSMRVAHATYESVAVPPPSPTKARGWQPRRSWLARLAKRLFA